MSNKHLNSGSTIRLNRGSKLPVVISDGVDCSFSGDLLVVKGKHGETSLTIPAEVNLSINEDKTVSILPASEHDLAIAGTIVALVKNMIIGVTELHNKSLKLVGVGYRASLQGNKIELSLGFSHPVVLEIPEGLSLNIPDQTSIAISGVDKQLVGQFAADIRALRPPEPYKGKGVRYSDERVIRKEAKKA